MVFYRKYRPRNLEELDSLDVRGKLRTILSRPSVHALLLTGPKGLGKTSAARIVAKVLNCEKLNLSPKSKVRNLEIEPCNKCPQCISITNGNNIDVLEIDGASNRGIDEIRDLREKVRLSPAYARKKVYIIDEVHMLTTEAFNALLKILEEPPSHVVFILCTTEPYKVPPTIASRCFHVALKRAKLDELVRSLERIVKNEKIIADKDSLLEIAGLSDGSFRDAAKILEEVFANAGRKKITKDLVSSIYQTTNIVSVVDEFLKFTILKDVKGAIGFLGKLSSSGMDMKYLSEQIISRIHEFLLEKVGVSKEKSDLSESLEITKIKELAEIFTLANSKIKYAVLPQLPLELAIIEWVDLGDVRSEGAEVVRVSLKTRQTHVENDAHLGLSKKQSLPHSLNESLSKSLNKKSKKDPTAFSSFSNGLPSSSVRPTNRDILSELINRVKTKNHSLAGILRGCILESYNGKRFVIGTKFKFHKEKLQDRKVRGILENALRETLGKRIPISIVQKS
ncbi:MAG: DNA polymerase III, subunit gamma and tau [Candidatus Levybacteria bacterium RIFCSPLOWO2_01_FULL_38_13]|nr:MAG: DNA polymerase III, subunit gamma and tau [Candidatus Levybacteria bacterium RIFCSPHIGHO2_01_FULL_41_15]OGH35085.1 MAG: DNA polymerase III, subunit gamma and tau [Candidatus Levybacteria bacterium RIFCSPLOWO2_01_FULL_38_13]